MLLNILPIFEWFDGCFETERLCRMFASYAECHKLMFDKDIGMICVVDFRNSIKLNVTSAKILVYSLVFIMVDMKFYDIWLYELLHVLNVFYYIVI